ncbi:capsid cement protein [Burkholderia glumae]
MTMSTLQPILTTSITATAGLNRFQFVGFDGGVCAAGAKALGVAETSAGVGEQAPVNLLGSILVMAGAPIKVEAEVQSDAAGQAIPKTDGASNGYALDAATAAGDVIRILRGI